jgi:hypothetical protein
MTILMAFAFSQFGWFFPVLIVALVIVIIVALCRMDHVRTAIWMRSSGFLLEANNDSPRRKPAGDGPNRDDLTS